MLGSSNRVVHMMVANHSPCPPNFCFSDPFSGLVVSGVDKGDTIMLCNILVRQDRILTILTVKKSR